MPQWEFQRNVVGVRPWGLFTYSSRYPCPILGVYDFVYVRFFVKHGMAIGIDLQRMIAHVIVLRVALSIVLLSAVVM